MNEGTAAEINRNVAAYAYDMSPRCRSLYAADPRISAACPAARRHVADAVTAGVERVVHEPRTVKRIRAFSAAHIRVTQLCFRRRYKGFHAARIGGGRRSDPEELPLLLLSLLLLSAA